MKQYKFSPDGNDLRKVLYYYGFDFDDKMICPFHDDHKPSCHINYDEGIFHCFACEASGDALDFVKLANPKIGGLNQLILYHSILNSKKVSKIKLNKTRRSKSGEVKKQEKENDEEVAHDYYFGLKTINWVKTKSDYKEYMKKRGFTSKALNMCGAKLTYSNDSYPLIFPIYDMDKFRGYVCRTTNKHVEKQRKYMYNKGFSRNNTLGGDYDSKVVVLCEGYMDALKLKQFGLKHVSAIFGWKITRQQIDKLKAMKVETIISALDMDKPGRKGTDYLKNFFDVVEFQFPTDAKDPGDLNKEQFDIAYRKTRRLYRRRRNR